MSMACLRLTSFSSCVLSMFIHLERGVSVVSGSGGNEDWEEEDEEDVRRGR